MCVSESKLSKDNGTYGSRKGERRRRCCSLVCSKIPALPGSTELLPGKVSQQQDLSWKHQGLQTQMALEKKRNEGVFLSKIQKMVRGFLSSLMENILLYNKGVLILNAVIVSCRVLVKDDLCISIQLFPGASKHDMTSSCGAERWCSPVSTAIVTRSALDLRINLVGRKK